MSDQIIVFSIAIQAKTYQQLNPKISQEYIYQKHTIPITFHKKAQENTL